MPACTHGRVWTHTHTSHMYFTVHAFVDVCEPRGVPQEAPRAAHLDEMTSKFKNDMRKKTTPLRAVQCCCMARVSPGKEQQRKRTKGMLDDEGVCHMDIEC
uniref:Uncharacterized protein n=1 Tax=Lotharella globosa TaxID=91324 RepID=A0A7S4DNL2_9EUKA